MAATPPVSKKITVDTDELKQKVAEMKEKVKDVAKRPEQLRDLYLARWLVARDWNVDAAVEMFKTSMKWREEFKADTIRETFPEECKADFENYRNYWPGKVTGMTHDGWPVAFERIGSVDPTSVMEKTTEEFRVKFNVYRMEGLEEERRKLEDKHGFSAGITMVTDVSGLGWAHYTSAAVNLFKAIANVNKNNYPEALRRSYVINAPGVFSMAWSVLTPFMDASTLKKTSIHGADFMPALLEVMPKESIPENLGGSAPPLPSGGIFRRPGEQPEEASKYTTVTVARGATFTQELNITCPAQITWEFLTQDYDIKFGLYFKINDKEREEVIAPETKNSHQATITGQYDVTKPGEYILEWDNTYSLLRSKTLQYIVGLEFNAGGSPAAPQC